MFSFLQHCQERKLKCIYNTKTGFAEQMATYSGRDILKFTEQLFHISNINTDALYITHIWSALYFKV